MERILLIFLSLSGFYFCYDFGHLLTGEFGLGQLVGIAFAVVLTILSSATIVTKNKIKRTFRVLTIGYTLSMLVLALLVTQIKTNDNAEDFYLYYPEWKIYNLFLWTFGTGMLVTLIVILIGYRNDRTEGIQ